MATAGLASNFPCSPFWHHTPPHAGPGGHWTAAHSPTACSPAMSSSSSRPLDDCPPSALWASQSAPPPLRDRAPAVHAADTDPGQVRWQALEPFLRHGPACAPGTQPRGGGPSHYYCTAGTAAAVPTPPDAAATSTPTCPPRPPSHTSSPGLCSKRLYSLFQSESPSCNGSPEQGDLGAGSARPAVSGCPPSPQPGPALPYSPPPRRVQHISMQHTSAVQVQPPTDVPACTPVPQQASAQLTDEDLDLDLDLDVDQELACAAAALSRLAQAMAAASRRRAKARLTLSAAASGSLTTQTSAGTNVEASLQATRVAGDRGMAPLMLLKALQGSTVSSEERLSLPARNGSLEFPALQSLGDSPRVTPTSPSSQGDCDSPRAPPPASTCTPQPPSEAPMSAPLTHVGSCGSSIGQASGSLTVPYLRTRRALRPPEAGKEEAGVQLLVGSLGDLFRLETSLRLDREGEREEQCQGDAGSGVIPSADAGFGSVGSGYPISKPPLPVRRTHKPSTSCISEEHSSHASEVSHPATKAHVLSSPGPVLKGDWLSATTNIRPPPLPSPDRLPSPDSQKSLSWPNSRELMQEQTACEPSMSGLAGIDTWLRAQASNTLSGSTEAPPSSLPGTPSRCSSIGHLVLQQQQLQLQRGVSGTGTSTGLTQDMVQLGAEERESQRPVHIRAAKPFSSVGHNRVATSPHSRPALQRTLTRGPSRLSLTNVGECPATPRTVAATVSTVLGSDGATRDFDDMPPTPTSRMSNTSPFAGAVYNRPCPFVVTDTGSQLSYHPDDYEQLCHEYPDSGSSAADPPQPTPAVPSTHLPPTTSSTTTSSPEQAQNCHISPGHLRRPHTDPVESMSSPYRVSSRLLMPPSPVKSQCGTPTARKSLVALWDACSPTKSTCSTMHSPAAAAAGFRPPLFEFLTRSPASASDAAGAAAPHHPPSPASSEELHMPTLNFLQHPVPAVASLDPQPPAKADGEEELAVSCNLCVAKVEETADPRSSLVIGNVQECAEMYISLSGRPSSQQHRSPARVLFVDHTGEGGDGGGGSSGASDPAEVSRPYGFIPQLPLVPHANRQCYSPASTASPFSASLALNDPPFPFRVDDEEDMWQLWVQGRDSPSPTVCRQRRSSSDLRRSNAAGPLSPTAPRHVEGPPSPTDDSPASSSSSTCLLLREPTLGCSFSLASPAASPPPKNQHAPACVHSGGKLGAAADCGQASSVITPSRVSWAESDTPSGNDLNHDALSGNDLSHELNTWGSRVIREPPPTWAMQGDSLSRSLQLPGQALDARLALAAAGELQCQPAPPFVPPRPHTAPTQLTQEAREGTLLPRASWSTPVAYQHHNVSATPAWPRYSARQLSGVPVSLAPAAPVAPSPPCAPPSAATTTHGSGSRSAPQLELRWPQPPPQRLSSVFDCLLLPPAAAGVKDGVASTAAPQPILSSFSAALQPVLSPDRLSRPTSAGEAGPSGSGAGIVLEYELNGGGAGPSGLHQGGAVYAPPPLNMGGIRIGSSDLPTTPTTPSSARSGLEGILETFPMGLPILKTIKPSPGRAATATAPNTAASVAADTSAAAAAPAPLPQPADGTLSSGAAAEVQPWSMPPVSPRRLGVGGGAFTATSLPPVSPRRLGGGGPALILYRQCRLSAPASNR